MINLTKINYIFRAPADRHLKIATVGWATTIKGNLFIHLFDAEITDLRKNTGRYLDDIQENYVRALQDQIELDDLKGIDDQIVIQDILKHYFVFDDAKSFICYLYATYNGAGDQHQ